MKQKQSFNRQPKWWYPLFGSTIRETIQDIKSIRVRTIKKKTSINGDYIANYTTPAPAAGSRRRAGDVDFMALPDAVARYSMGCIGR